MYLANGSTDTRKEVDVDGKGSYNKCDKIDVLDQCTDIWKEVCAKKCAQFRSEAEAATCVDLQGQGESVQIAMKKLLGLDDQQIKFILSKQPFFSWEQVESKLSTEHASEESGLTSYVQAEILPKLKKDSICPFPGEDVASPVEASLECVDINKGREELKRVDGIGDGLAKKIEAMQADGEFKTWDDFFQRSSDKLMVNRGNDKQHYVKIITTVHNKCSLFCQLNGKQPYPCKY
jgi:DNA uptake protein ComE-like DNA-binding protein